VIHIWVGYDEREAVGYPVFCHSVLARTRAEVAFYPVRGDKVEGSTRFNKGRFDVPSKMGYRGWAIWAECDMLCLTDIERIFEHADSRCDVMVVKHEYRTKHPVKFLGQPNPDYPGKNRSSLMLINCGQASWRRIPQGRTVAGVHRPWTLPELHGFQFMDQDRVGSLPKDWNHLVGEYKPNPAAKLAHFTVGLPIWPEYANCEHADAWRAERAAMLDFQQVAVECAPVA
jgi:hypothetical protein